VATPADIHTVIQRMVEVLVAVYQPQKVILFGSYNYGRPDRDSDIDLFIIKDTLEPFFQRCVTVRQVLKGLHPSIPIEPLVLTPQEVDRRLAIWDQFIAEILERGKVLYAA